MSWPYLSYSSFQLRLAGHAFGAVFGWKHSEIGEGGFIFFYLSASEEGMVCGRASIAAAAVVHWLRIASVHMQSVGRHTSWKPKPRPSARSLDHVSIEDSALQGHSIQCHCSVDLGVCMGGVEASQYDGGEGSKVTLQVNRYAPISKDCTSKEGEKGRCRQNRNLAEVETPFRGVLWNALTLFFRHGCQ